jgi:hypothetical protein
MEANVILNMFDFVSQSNLTIGEGGVGLGLNYKV